MLTTKGENWLQRKDADSPLWCKMVLEPSDIDMTKNGLTMFTSRYFDGQCDVVLAPGAFMLVAAAVSERVGYFGKGWIYQHALITALSLPAGDKLISVNSDHMYKSLFAAIKRPECMRLIGNSKSKMLTEAAPMMAAYSLLSVSGLLKSDEQPVMPFVLLTDARVKPKRRIDRGIMLKSAIAPQPVVPMRKAEVPMALRAHGPDSKPPPRNG